MQPTKILLYFKSVTFEMWWIASNDSMSQYGLKLRSNQQDSTGQGSAGALEDNLKQSNWLGIPNFIQMVLKMQLPSHTLGYIIVRIEVVCVLQGGKTLRKD